MAKVLSLKYTPSSKDSLTNELIPAWYTLEKSNIISELSDVSKVALTSDSWTCISQDWIKAIKIKAVYEAQEGPVVAKEMSDVLQEFGINQ